MSDAHVILEEPLQPAAAKPQEKGQSHFRLLGVVMFLALALGALLIALGQSRVLDREDGADDSMPKEPMQRALALMSAHPLIDGHNDLPWQYRDMREGRVLTPPTFDLTQNLTSLGLQTDLPKIRSGHLGAQFWSVYVRCGMPDAVRATLEEVDIVKAFVELHGDRMELAHTADDVERIFRSGKLASLMGMEGGHSIDSSLGALRQLYALGVRYMSLTHNCNLPWVESCCTGGPDAPPQWKDVRGLTNVSASQGQLSGEDIILEMNRIGMMVDLSHTHPRTMRDVLRISKAPVMFSHSAVQAINPHPRNVPDDVLDLLAARDGILMVAFISEFTQSPLDPPGVRNHAVDIANQVDYIRNRTGSVRHIGVGADFEGDVPSNFPEDMDSVDKYPLLFAELVKRGYTDGEIVDILGGNILRVMRQVEAVSRELKAQPASSRQGEKRMIYADAKGCRSEF